MTSTPAAPSRAAALLLATLVGLPVACVVAWTAGAAFRHTLGVPMATAAWLGAAATMVVAAGWLHASLRAGGVAWAAAVPGVVTALAVVASMVQQLVMTTQGALVTVGGGDFGNHLSLAEQLVDRMPKVYVGFTGWHATAWSVAQLFELNIGDAAAVAVHAGAGAAWAVAAVAAVALGAAGRTGAAAWIGASVSGLALLWLAQGWGFALTHYLAAEGFVGQLHALLPWHLAFWAVATARSRLGRWLGAAMSLALLRFVYGIDLPEQLLALAMLAWAISASDGATAVAAIARTYAGWPGIAVLSRWSRAPLPRLLWPWLWRGAAALFVLEAIVFCLLLSLSWKKAGSVMTPTLTGRELALGIGVAASLLLAMTGRKQRGAAAWLLVCIGAGALLVGMHLLLPSIPRQYYLFKHGMLLEWMGLLAAASALGAACAAWIDRPPHGPDAPTAVAGTTRWRVLPALVALCAAGLVIWAPGRIAASNARLFQGYQEHIGARPWAQIAPLVDPSLPALAATLRDEGWTIAGVLHPHWPVYNFATSAAHGWRPIEPDVEIALQEKRWTYFVNAGPIEPGTCVVFAAAPHRLQEWARHRGLQKGPAGEHVLRWHGEADRCVDGPALAPWLPPERACARCQPHDAGGALGVEAAAPWPIGSKAKMLHAAAEAASGASMQRGGAALPLALLPAAQTIARIRRGPAGAAQPPAAAEQAP